nr:3-methyl-2-oxobutanoate hydroxymethyltransferase 1, mitochondrial-like isoform X1 [Tanacetum cinerariifolium]
MPPTSSLPSFMVCGVGGRLVPLLSLVNQEEEEEVGFSSLSEPHTVRSNAANVEGGCLLPNVDQNLEFENRRVSKRSWIQWCFYVVLECVPAPVAIVGISPLEIPVIGVAADPFCIGQTELILCSQLVLFHDSLKVLSKDEFGPWNDLCGKRINDAYERFQLPKIDLWHSKDNIKQS